MGCLNFHWNSISKYEFFTSLFISPRSLLLFRLVFFLWNFPCAIIIGVDNWQMHDAEGHNTLKLGVTLSYISYCSIIIYFFTMLLHTYNNKLIYKQCVSYNYELLNIESQNNPQPITFTMKLSWILFEILLPVSSIVTIVYWSMLYPSEPHHNYWSTLQMHAFNSVGMLGEFFFNRLLFIPLHSIFFMVAGTSYIIWAICVHAITDEWVYPFLNYSAHTWSPVMYPALIVGGLSIYFLYWYLQRKIWAKYNSIQINHGLHGDSTRLTQPTSEQYFNGSHNNNKATAIRNYSPSESLLMNDHNNLNQNGNNNHDLELQPRNSSWLC